MQAEKQVCLRPRIKSRGRTPDGQPNKIDLHIGRRIRLRRCTLGWSQEKIAGLLGLTFQQIQKYERGANRVSGSRLYDFACVLGVDVGFFYEDMPEDIRRQSPRYISAEKPIAETEIETLITQTDDPMRTDRALTIMHCFRRIASPDVADALYELIQMLGIGAVQLNKTNTEKDV